MATTRREVLGSVCALAGATLLPQPAQSEQETKPPSASEPVSLADFETLARTHIPAMFYEYISGGAADEITLRWNREAFDRLRLRPPILVDVSQLDTRLTLFG
jgi:4-hydroxymandelate oxidase